MSSAWHEVAQPQRAVLMETHAEFSRCRRYRYALWRRWSSGPQVLFVMLNPSSADEMADDATIRRCIGLAKAWGFGALAVGNLFALRSTAPIALRHSPAPIEADDGSNDRWLRRLQRAATLTIAAWGNHGAWQGRSYAVRAMLHDPHILGLTQRGEPRHPLYVPARTQPQPWPNVSIQEDAELA